MTRLTSVAELEAVYGQLPVAHSITEVGSEPKTVIVVNVESVYFQCARAIKRSELWKPERFVEPGAVPTAGQMTRAASDGDFDGETYDAQLANRQAITLY